MKKKPTSSIGKNLKDKLKASKKIKKAKNGKAALLAKAGHDLQAGKSKGGSATVYGGRWHKDKKPATLTILQRILGVKLKK